MVPYLRDQVASYVSRLPDGPGRTLEIGAADVNGSVRDLFTDYVGTDMRPAPGVDLVVNAHDLLHFFSPGSFDTIVCLETLEHDDAFWVTVQVIRTLLQPLGHLILSAPAIGYGQHSCPFDYWRFTEEAFRLLLRGMSLIELKTMHSDTVIAFAEKPYDSITALEAATRRIEELETLLSMSRSGPMKATLAGVGTVRHGN